MLFIKLVLLTTKRVSAESFISESIFVLFETFLAHFLNGPLQQIKKHLTATFKILKGKII